MTRDVIKTDISVMPEPEIKTKIISKLARLEESIDNTIESLQR